MSSRLQPDVLAKVDALEADGRFLEAIDVLNSANQQRRDPEVERRLVGVRHQAFEELDRSAKQTAPLPSPAGEVPFSNGIPAASPDTLSARAVHAGISTGGCLLVPGLIPRHLVDRLVDDIDRAIEGYDAHAAGATLSDTIPWFAPFAPAERYRKGGKVPAKRASVRSGGGVWTTDSPRTLYDLAATFDEVQLTPVIRDFLGERPALSMNKCTLRRVPLDTLNASWHQDGAFLGTPIRTLNVWLALSHGGRDAPGLDILPRRLDGIVETGTEGSIFPWAVSPLKVEEASRGTPISRPIFEPGDALLFDELFLHRTACEPEMTRARYAIETWLFAPSVYPDKQIPLVV